jgi:hypothetical protein
VITPMIQGELIQIKTYYNYKNQDVLIHELEQRFQCEFINFGESIYLVKDKEDDENNIGKQIGLSPDMPSKEVLKM